MADKITILNDLNNILRKQLGTNVKDVILFGSHVSDYHTDDSDYDFLVVLRKKADWKLKRKISDYCYEIDLWSTSNEFLIGHRIGLAISSSNFPRISRNLNTGGDNELNSDFVKANQTILHDSEYPSHLILPIIENC